jgi:hypothetical protein
MADGIVLLVLNVIEVTSSGSVSETFGVTVVFEVAPLAGAAT